MQTTEYFAIKQKKAGNQFIKEDWIRMVYNAPEHVVVQEDGRVQLYSKIREMNGAYLRVSLLKDKRTVRDACFVNNLGSRSIKRLRHRLGAR